MGHRLITGTTECGKSSLARELLKHTKNDGIVGVVYDPLLSGGWDCEPDDVTDDIAHAIELVGWYYGQGKPVHFVIDEADTCLSLANRENFWIATKIRHFGVTSTFISQRPQMLAPTVRNMCSEVYCFLISSNDAKFLADDKAAPGLLEANCLPQGTFLKCGWKDQKRHVEKFKLF